MKVKTLTKKLGDTFSISEYPNFHRSGSITGMKRMYYGRDALLVRCGNYIYNVSERPEIYLIAE